MIAIIAAVGEELDALIKAQRFTRIDGPAHTFVYRGTLNGPDGGRVEIFALLTGIGRERAQEATAWLVRTHQPDAVVSMGFGGATRDSLAAGTLVLATSLVPLAGSPLEWEASALGEVLSPDQSLLSRARGAVELSGIDFIQGPMVTVPIIARSPGLKRWLGATFGVYSADLESYWVARTAQSAAVPFLAVRAVVDTTATTLPEIVSKIPGAARGARIRPALAYAMRDPRRVVQLTRLHRASSKASRQIARFVAAFLSSSLDDSYLVAGGAAA